MRIIPFRKLCFKKQFSESHSRLIHDLEAVRRVFRKTNVFRRGASADAWSASKDKDEKLNWRFKQSTDLTVPEHSGETAIVAELALPPAGDDCRMYVGPVRQFDNTASR